MLVGQLIQLIIPKIKMKLKQIRWYTQKNGCHLVDFLCATAAWDFFTAKDGFKADKAAFITNHLN